MMNNALLSSNRDDWETPKSFFDELNSEFHFTLDPCTNGKNSKCAFFFTKEDNGLEQDWGRNIVFCNPPYSKKGNQDLWVKKCYTSAMNGATVVALLPARTDTVRFHKYILNKAEIRFIKGRICFELNGTPILDKNGKPSPAPFSSMVCIWRSSYERA